MIKAKNKQPKWYYWYENSKTKEKSYPTTYSFQMEKNKLRSSKNKVEI